MRFVNEVGTSSFIAFSERNADASPAPLARTRARTTTTSGWHGIIKPWMPRRQRGGQLLYLDGHAVTLAWQSAGPGHVPDKWS